MKLCIDDERTPIEPGWEIVRSTLDAFIYLNLHANGDLQYHIEELSLDHDLGEDALNGCDVARNLEEKVLQGMCLPPNVLQVHSGNSVGVQNILDCFKSIVRYCEREGLEVPTIRRVQVLDFCQPMT